jgi:hypothetical protein
MIKWKKPTSVKIGALTYKIRYVVPGKGKELLENENGCINQNRHLIEIDKNLSDQMTLMVLIHELFHGVGDAMSPNHSPFGKENFVCTVTELMIQAMQSAKLIPILSNDLPRRRPEKRRGKN